MILIPEIETVLILTPRTASGSLKQAVLNRYPSAMPIYRHMEADGVPHGYDRWRKIGVLRNPIERLWSLYKFLRGFAGNYEPAYIAAMRASVAMPFSDWLVNNMVVFTSPYDSAGSLKFFAKYTVRHPLPENRKSQFVYLRPDLGTQIVEFSALANLAGALDVDLGNQNVTTPEPVPPLTLEAEEHCWRYFKWDFERCGIFRSQQQDAA
jgi:hypothetical protein